MTLCGVLKDVLLVVASMIIWGTEVTGLQFFGYSLALCGMVYYKLGYDTIKAHAGEASRQWAEFGNRKPVLRRISIIAMVLLTLFFVFHGLAPAGIDATDYINEAKTKIGMRL